MAIKTLVLGGPGAGKTEHLIQLAQEYIRAGVPSTKIAFVSFTRAAIHEARDRAIKQFGLEPSAFPWWRTIHSLAFRALGLRRSEIFSNMHLKEFGRVLDEDLTPDHPLLTVEGRARAMRIALEDAYDLDDGGLEWFRLKRFADALHRYKHDLGLLDFTDLLSQYDRHGQPVPIQVAIVDEAQDLTRLQWSVVERAFSGADEVWAAGDDDQAIHEWAGADTDHFLSLTWPRRVLPLSHRLPRDVFELSQEIAGRIGRRFPKAMNPTDRRGAVNWLRRPDEVDLTSGTWLLLARTRSQLADHVAVARDQGVTYIKGGVSSIDPEKLRAIRTYENLRRGERVVAEELVPVLELMELKRNLIPERAYRADELGIDAGPIWHDALSGWAIDEREYYLTCLRRGENITKTPRVRIDTIHGAKGLQAENVLLSLNLNYRIARAAEREPDSEHRVFYVGVTRASESLNLLTPTTPYGYRI